MSFVTKVWHPVNTRTHEELFIFSFRLSFSPSSSPSRTQIADRIYPNVPADYQPPTTSAPEVYDNSEDEMDAIMNGAPSNSKATTSSSTQPSNEGETVKSKPKEQELDIESQIQAELAELQGGKKGPKSKAGKEKENAGQKPPKTRRFRSLDTDTECREYHKINVRRDPKVLLFPWIERSYSFLLPNGFLCLSFLSTLHFLRCSLRPLRSRSSSFGRSWEDRGM